MSVTPTNCVHDLTFDAVKAEAYSAHIKHGGNSILNPALPDAARLPVLVEEVGEVAKAMTYDNASPDELIKELLQVAAVAVTWIEAIEKRP